MKQLTYDELNAVDKVLGDLKECYLNKLMDITNPFERDALKYAISTIDIQLMIINAAFDVTSSSMEKELG